MRYLLLAAGILLVAGIYLWDRWQRRVRTRQAPRTVERSEETPRREPVFVDKRAAAPVAAPAIDADASVEDALQDLAALVRAEESEFERGAGAPAEWSFSAEVSGDDAYAADARLPKKIIVINVVAKGAFFSGDAVSRAARDVGLEPGDMDIYHRYDERQSHKVLFSVASMVEPGTFPLADMDGFSTPGLTLFTQLPGPRDGLAIYADLLFTAERLAALLDAELQDANHSVLTKQTIEHTRDDILEHRRQLQLARPAS